MSGNDPSLDLGGIASGLYANGSIKTRWRQKMRLVVCPFAPIVASVPPESHVLDVGCGDGLLLGLLLKLGRASTAVGFDTNANAIRSARYMAERNGFGTSAVFSHLGPDSSWPTEDGPFDVVTMIDVMHHLSPTAQDGVWTRAADALRPGGLFVYKDMASRPLWMALANRVHDLVFAADWIHYADFERGVRQAHDAGLAERRRDAYSRLWYRHEMLVCVRL